VEEPGKIIPKVPGYEAFWNTDFNHLPGLMELVTPHPQLELLNRSFKISDFRSKYL